MRVYYIWSGYTFFQAVDVVAETIREAGDVADPIHTDACWPEFLSGE